MEWCYFLPGTESLELVYIRCIWIKCTNFPQNFCYLDSTVVIITEIVFIACLCCLEVLNVCDKTMKIE